MRTPLTAFRRLVRRRSLPRAAVSALAAAMLPTLLGACGWYSSMIHPTGNVPLAVAGDPVAGARLIKVYGCGSCHLIPGINNADSLVGPPLIQWRRRIYIAGLLRNTPDNLRTWIQHPQQIVPNNAMPDMGIGPQQAQDIVAYLYTLD